MKRLEHFWKGLSNDEKQISPIPPERYGDRFVRFISGIAKSQELVSQEEETERANQELHTETPEANGEVYAHAGPGRSVSTEMGSNNDVMDRAERSKERQSRELDREDSRAKEKTLTTTRSPSAERGEASGFTLPVVEEANEDKSTGGRSNEERERSGER